MQRVTLERIWERTDRSNKSGCWFWEGPVFNSGYGMTAHRLAHRLVYELSFGRIPAGRCVCHKCDEKLCLNPKHLFVGTQADNIADKMAKGRHRVAHGEDNGQSKLTTAEAKKIKASAESTRKLAGLYGVCDETIRNIRVGVTWKAA